MTTKTGMTKQGVRDLNQLGPPRPRKEAPPELADEKPKATSSAARGGKAVAR